MTCLSSRARVAQADSAKLFKSLMGSNNFILSFCFKRLFKQHHPLPLPGSAARTAAGGPSELRSGAVVRNNSNLSLTRLWQSSPSHSREVPPPPGGRSFAQAAPGVRETQPSSGVSSHGARSSQPSMGVTLRTSPWLQAAHSQMPHGSRAEVTANAARVELPEVLPRGRS